MFCRPLYRRYLGGNSTTSEYEAYKKKQVERVKKCQKKIRDLDEREKEKKRKQWRDQKAFGLLFGPSVVFFSSPFLFYLDHLFHLEEKMRRKDKD